jgi:hypothetical protein
MGGMDYPRSSSAKRRERAEKRELMKRQIEDGTLVVRQMSDEERQRWQRDREQRQQAKR